MIDRYATEAMDEVWSDKGRFGAMAAVVSAYTGVDAEPPDPSYVRLLEGMSGHETMAFLAAIGAGLDPGVMLHYGLTSSDLSDTALALQLKHAHWLIHVAAVKLSEELQNTAAVWWTTPMLGRTHGQPAELITYGLKVERWRAGLTRRLAMLSSALGEAALGKLAGAVGTHPAGATVEAETLLALELGPDPWPTQVVARDRLAEYVSAAALMLAELERWAVSMRLMAQPEVGELLVGGPGSSAMPHKSNPTELERISGFARLARGYVGAAFEDVALWHERDMSHSSVERVIVPGITSMLETALVSMLAVFRRTVVQADRMQANIDATRGRWASGALVMLAQRSGLSYHEAWRLVRQAVDESLELDRTLEAQATVIFEDIDAASIEQVFDQQAEVERLLLSSER